MANLTTDKNLDKHLRVVKSGGEETSLELATRGNGVNVVGDFEVSGKYSSIYLKDYAPIRTNQRLDLISDGTILLDTAGVIVLDSGNGRFIARKDGTEFSAANSAYAGMILGYTCLLNDAADTSYSVTTSFVTVDSTANLTFTAPPSGNVEIFVSVFCKWASNRWLQFGLSDNSTYSAIDVTHEHFIGEGDETDEMQINHQWVITGLTAGTSYTYYLGAKAEQASRVTLYWGGDATGEYAPLIMKATALPTIIYTG